MKLVGLAKGGREPIELAIFRDNEEYWTIEGDFIVISIESGRRVRAKRIPSHIDAIEVRPPNFVIKNDQDETVLHIDAEPGSARV